ncbi:MAG TPA: nucleoside hydrolase [Parafilimonas sp.]|nr:nucleoside hydrolase [Parafilimonas sp.]
MTKILFIALLTCSLSCSEQNSSTPQPIIFDSDMGPDYDDVGAITMLHAYADSGYINVLATVASTRYEGVAAVMNVFNTYFNRPNIPIGIAKQNGLTLRDWQHWTDTLIKNYPHQIKTNNDVPDAVEVYRKALASQPDTSVTIVTTGFLTNLANLLRSQPDNYSSLDGAALVKQKVKQLVSMGGRFPEGKEFNLDQDAASSRYVFSNWPTKVLFSGFEIGDKIKVGLPLIHNDQIHGSPVKDVFTICIPMAAEDSTGRKSWDETALLVAVKGSASFYKLHHGSIVIAEDGSNTWDDNGAQSQSYLEEAVSPEIVQSYINNLIQHQPGGNKK